MNSPTNGGLLEELYREIILDHYRNPRNQNELVVSTCSADGSNPLCGDQIHLEIDYSSHVIHSISFSGDGCSISQASASMMTETVIGKSFSEIQMDIESFQHLMRNGTAPENIDMGDIEALSGVSKFPARIKCALLGWKTLEQAINTSNNDKSITTDEER